MTKFKENGPINITLGPDVRFMWPFVFEKRPNDEGEDKYEVVVQIPYSNKKAIALIEDAIEEAITRGFSGTLSEKSTFKKGTKENALKIPLKDGADKENDDYADMFDGYMYLSAKTSRKPTVLDENAQQIIDPEEFFTGAVGAVSLTVFPYNNRAQGVGVQLNHIMKLGGERIGGGTVSAEEAFADYIPRGGNGRSRRDRDAEPNAGTRRATSRTRQAASDDPMFN